jgi:hypothetical protein
MVVWDLGAYFFAVIFIDAARLWTISYPTDMIINYLQSLYIYNHIVYIHIYIYLSIVRVTVAAVIFFKKSATEWMTTQIQIDLGFPPQRP